MLAWAAESLNNVSVYIYDATRMVLPLLGDDGSGAGHDWHNILARLGLLEHTDGIAYTVRTHFPERRLRDDRLAGLGARRRRKFSLMRSEIPALHATLRKSVAAGSCSDSGDRAIRVKEQRDGTGSCSG